MLATSCKLKNIFRKRIEKRLLDSRFRIQFQKASDFSFLTKSLNFLRKIQSRRLDRRCLRWHRNSLSLQLVAASILIFSAFARQQSVFTGNSTELVIGFRILKVLLDVSGKRQVRRHVDEVWTFASDRKNVRCDFVS